MKNSILDQWKRRAGETPDKTPYDSSGKFPLSSAQLRLWSIYQLAPKSLLYNYCEQYSVNGSLNLEKLESALRHTVDQFPIIKKNIILDKGQPWHIQNPEFSITIDYMDVSLESQIPVDDVVNENILKFGSRPIKLENDSFLFVRCLKISPDEYVIGVLLPHIICDKWSLKEFRKQWFENYFNLIQGTELKVLNMASSYAQFVSEAEVKSNSDVLNKYWSEKLRDVPLIMELPIDGISQESKDYGKHLYRSLDFNLVNKVIQFCAEQQITPFIYFLTIFKIYLSKVGNAAGVNVATPVSTRGRAEYEKTFGFFNDTILLNSSFNWSAKFTDVLFLVQKVAFDGFAHKDVGFEKLLKLIDPVRGDHQNPLFNVMFLYHKNEEEKHRAFNDVQVKTVDLGVSKFDLTFYVEELSGELNLCLEYSTNLFASETIHRIFDHLNGLIEHSLSDPSLSISEYDIHTQSEKTNFQLLEDLKLDASRPDLFMRQFQKKVLENPSAIAISDDKGKCTYGQLNNRSRAFSHAFRQRENNEPIGLIVDRSITMIAAMLGALHAGRPYIPIDPNYPDKRIYFMLEDAQVQDVVLGEGIDKNRFSMFNAISETSNIQDGDLSSEGIKLDDVAYIIYTSGSSGKPKGVKVSHRNLFFSNKARNIYYHNQPDNFLLLSSFSFDSSVAGIYWTLANGGSLIIAPQNIEQNIESLGALISAERVTHTLLIPRLYEVLLENCSASKLKSLEVVIVAGSACPVSLKQNHFDVLPECQLYNEYGPTEGTVWSSVFELLAHDKNQVVPIGQNAPHARLYVLDQKLQRVLQGTVGELFIGGEATALGYLNDPDKTKISFIKNPYIADDRLYATGDLVRLNNAQQLEYLGRKDNQIKIRGFRVETESIDSAIKNFTEVSSVLTCLFEDFGLIAFLESSTISESELRSFLKEEFPDYMVPTAFHFIDKMPELPNGKIDVKQLKESYLIDRSRHLKTDRPITPLEQRLLNIWRSVLKKENINVTDKYFSIGGDSIKSIQIVSAAMEDGLGLTAKNIFENQTIERIAEEISLGTANRPIAQNMAADLSLLPMQKWFFEQNFPNPGHWNMALSWEVHDSLSFDACATAIDQVLQDYPQLSDVFILKNSNLKKERKPFSTHDVISRLTSEKQISDLDHQFEIDKGPLFRFLLVGENQRIRKIYFEAHHLIVDAVSLSLLQAKLNRYLLERFSKIERAVPQVETANAQVNLVKSGFFDDEIDFWNLQKYIPLRFQENSSQNSRRIDQNYSMPIAEWNVAKQAAKDVFGMNGLELITTAFIWAYQKMTNEEGLTINIEHHGRVSLGDYYKPDTSFGWLTSFYPLTFNFGNSQALTELFVDIKEQSRKVKNNGVGYGFLRYHSSANLPKEWGDVTINYIPAINKSESGEILRDAKFDLTNTRAKENKSRVLLALNAIEGEEEIEFRWNHFENVDTNFNLQENLISVLTQVKHFGSSMSRVYSPSDFPKSSLLQSDLNILTHEIDLNRTNLFALSDVQSGLLFHHLNADNDLGSIVFQARLQGRLKRNLFADACKNVWSQQEFLHLLLKWENLTRPQWVKPEKSEIDYTEIPVDTVDAFESEYRELTKAFKNENIQLNEDPISKFILLTDLGENHALFWLQHHIQVDGFSAFTFFNQVVSAYDRLHQDIKPHRLILPRVESVVDRPSQRALSSSKAFWRGYFKNHVGSYKLFQGKRAQNQSYEKVELKLSTSETISLTRFCEENNLSKGIFLQTIWGVVVAKLLSQNSAIFGNTVSGRPRGIKNINQLVGSFAHVVPARIELANDKLISAWLQEVQTRELQTVDHDLVGLGTIINWLDFPSFELDTLLVIENLPEVQKPKNDLNILEIEGGLTSSYPISTFVLIAEELLLKLQFDASLVNVTEANGILMYFKSLLINSCQVKKVLQLPKLPIKLIGVFPKQMGYEGTRDEIEPPSNETELVVLNIWQRVFGFKEIGVADNFFEIGGSSLKAMRLLALVQEQFDLNIAPTVLLKRSTIKELAKMLGDGSAKSSWDTIVPLKTSGSRTPLFCFHAGDGHVFYYKYLADAIHPEQPLYVVQPLGLEDGHLEFNSIREVAESYLDSIRKVQPRGPYRLLGTCYSNAIAYEIQNLLEDQGDKVDCLFIVDSAPPFFRGQLNPFYSTRRYLGRIKQSVKSVFSKSPYRDLSLVENRLANIQSRMNSLIINYKWKPSESAIILIRSTQFANDPSKNFQFENWNKLAQNGVISKVIESSHLNLFTDVSSKDLADCMEPFLTQQ